MDFMSAYRPTSYLHLGNNRIRVYHSFLIHPREYSINGFNPHRMTQYLRYHNPIFFPYAWYVYGFQAAVVNFTDLYRHEIGLTSSVPSLPVVPNQQHEEYDTAEEVYIMDEQINESFEEAASHVPCSGLTNKLISKNLRVTIYCEEEKEEEEEEGDICVVCQVEFESNERLAVLPCKHRYHARCITEWLVRKNVCPICKGQGLSVV